MRHQYALAYSPAGRAPDGKYHTIRIQTDRKDVIVRARKGYYSVPIPAQAMPAKRSLNRTGISLSGFDFCQRFLAKADRLKPVLHVLTVLNRLARNTRGA